MKNRDSRFFCQKRHLLYQRMRGVRRIFPRFFLAAARFYQASTISLAAYFIPPPLQRCSPRKGWRSVYANGAAGGPSGRFPGKDAGSIIRRTAPASQPCPTGSRMVTRVPTVSFEVISSEPPCIETISSAIARPIPEPRRVAFALKNFSLIRGRSASRMPHPVSRTVMRT